LKYVVELLLHHQLFAKLSKYTFVVVEIEYLDHLLS